MVVIPHNKVVIHFERVGCILFTVDLNSVFVNLQLIVFVNINNALVQRQIIPV